jgi:hypothetical protein
LCCSGSVDIGVLCRACARDVSPCDNLIPDHVRSTVPTAEAAAWLVDGFGNAHALAKTSTVGRSHDGHVVVLASSVSREHAELQFGDDGWAVRDLRSRNGTFVDGVRCQGRAVLPTRAQLKVGDVALWFLAEVHDEPDGAAAAATVSAGAIVRYLLTTHEVELCIVGAVGKAGGALMSRPMGSHATAWAERSLTPLEFQFLRMLCHRAVEEAGSPAEIRGCISSKQLARDLDFQTKFANEENVRQIVRRLRVELVAVGTPDLVAAAPGRGYYITCPVTAGAAIPRG